MSLNHALPHALYGSSFLAAAEAAIDQERLDIAFMSRP